MLLRALEQIRTSWCQEMLQVYVCGLGGQLTSSVWSVAVYDCSVLVPSSSCWNALRVIMKGLLCTKACI